MLFGQSDSVRLSDFEIDAQLPNELAATMINFPDSTEIAIALVNADGTVIFHGCRRSNARLEAVDNQKALFQIGSITKVFTATSLAKMVIEDHITLDASIQDYYDFSFKDGQVITFESLANHSSGLSRLPTNMKYASYQDPYRLYDGDLLEALLAEQIDLNEKAYSYSNLGAGLLGYTLAKINKSDYNTLIKEQVTAPLQLNNTGQFPEELNPSYLVSGRNYEGKTTSYWHMDALAGCGVLYSTVDDLSRFILAQFNAKNRELALSRNPTLEVNDNYSVGLGWHILHNPKRNDWWWHNGAVGGFVASMAFDPKEKIGVVVLSNVSAFHPKMSKIDQLCFNLLDAQLKE